MLLEQSYPEAALMSGGSRRCNHDNYPEFIAFAAENVALARNRLRKRSSRCVRIATIPRKIHERRMRTPAFLAKRVKMDAA